MAVGTISTKKTSGVWLSSLDGRKIVVGQITLLLGEVGVLSIVFWKPIEGMLLLVAAHIWAWRQCIWRRQNIITLMQAIREAAGTDVQET